MQLVTWISFNIFCIRHDKEMSLGSKRLATYLHALLCITGTDQSHQILVLIGYMDRGFLLQYNELDVYKMDTPI